MVDNIIEFTNSTVKSPIEIQIYISCFVSFLFCCLHTHLLTHIHTLIFLDANGVCRDRKPQTIWTKM